MKNLNSKKNKKSYTPLNEEHNDLHKIVYRLGKERRKWEIGERKWFLVFLFK